MTRITYTVKSEDYVLQSQILEEVCNEACRERNTNKLQIRCSDPPVFMVTDINGDIVSSVHSTSELRMTYSYCK